jgi:hypothetical protein
MDTEIKNVHTERWQQTCLYFIINSDMKTYTITVDYEWSCQEKSFDFITIIIMDCDACMYIVTVTATASLATAQ